MISEESRQELKIEENESQGLETAESFLSMLDNPQYSLAPGKNTEADKLFAAIINITKESCVFPLEALAICLQNQKLTHPNAKKIAEIITKNFSIDAISKLLSMLMSNYNQTLQRSSNVAQNNEMPIEYLIKALELHQLEQDESIGNWVAGLLYPYFCKVSRAVLLCGINFSSDLESVLIDIGRDYFSKSSFVTGELKIEEKTIRKVDYAPKKFRTYCNLIRQSMEKHPFVDECMNNRFKLIEALIIDIKAHNEEIPTPTLLELSQQLRINKITAEINELYKDIKNCERELQQIGIAPETEMETKKILIMKMRLAIEEFEKLKQNESDYDKYKQSLKKQIIAGIVGQRLQTVTAKVFMDIFLLEFSTIFFKSKLDSKNIPYLESYFSEPELKKSLETILAIEDNQIKNSPLYQKLAFLFSSIKFNEDFQDLIGNSQKRKLMEEFLSIESITKINEKFIDYAWFSLQGNKNKQTIMDNFRNCISITLVDPQLKICTDVLMDGKPSITSETIFTVTNELFLHCLYRYKDFEKIFSALSDTEFKKDGAP